MVVVAKWEGSRRAAKSARARTFVFLCSNKIGWAPCPDLTLGEAFPPAVKVQNFLSQHTQCPLGAHLHPRDQDMHYYSHPHC